MSADPAYQSWRGMKLYETDRPYPQEHDGEFMTRRVDQIAANILSRAKARNLK